MKNSLLHTPDGVRDLYNLECERKLVLEERMKECLSRYGYAPIQTPTFEFFDIFSHEIGTTPSKDLYKFFDKEGNTLVLRPDITPSIARAVTKYYGEETMPIRLWYHGNTFLNNSSYQGRLKESTQIGAELVGDDSVDADAEMIALVVEELKKAGLKEFQVTIGHVDFLKGLLHASGLSEDIAEEIKEYIYNKNFFGVEERIAPLPLPENVKNLFLCLDKIYANAEELKDVLALSEGYPLIQGALERLIALMNLLDAYGVSDYVSIEPGMCSTYRYYTGIIFAGYTFGSGEPVVKGGRYDDLLPYFGKDAPSIGFAIIVDQLMAALSRQNLEIPLREEKELLVYDEAMRTEAIHRAQKRRQEDAQVILMRWEPGRSKQDYEAYAAGTGCKKVTFLASSFESGSTS